MNHTVTIQQIAVLINNIENDIHLCGSCKNRRDKSLWIRIKPYGKCAANVMSYSYVIKKNFEVVKSYSSLEAAIKYYNNIKL